MSLDSSCWRRAFLRPLTTGWIFGIYSILYSIAFAALTIAYYNGVSAMRSEFVNTHPEIVIPAILASVFNAPFFLYVLLADGLYYFIHYRSHSLQKAMIGIFLLSTVIWTGNLIFLLIKFPLMNELILEYVILILAIVHSPVIAFIAFKHIWEYHRFISEAERLNDGFTAADATTLFTLVAMRRLFTKPIIVAVSKSGTELNDGQLAAFHWDDYYRLNRWIEELRNEKNGIQTVLSEMERRLGIYDVPNEGWAIPPPMGIQKIEETPPVKNQLKAKLISLHADDHRQISEWIQSLRCVSEPNAEVINSITEQMRNRAALYDLTEETKVQLNKLARFGINLRVPEGQTLEDRPKTKDLS